MHLAAPASTDYWVNDQHGDPLFVVTADANAGMTRMLSPVLRSRQRAATSACRRRPHAKQTRKRGIRRTLHPEQERCADHSSLDSSLDSSLELKVDQKIAQLLEKGRELWVWVYGS
jgi:hypothetical protein